MKDRTIISNRIKTPDGTILISRHVHDYVSHKDKITKKEYVVDGGHSMLRRAGDSDYEELSVFSDDNFHLIRNTMEWGTRGINGLDSLKYVTLKCMTDAHITNILKTQLHILSSYKDAFKKELAFRKKNDISIK